MDSVQTAPLVKSGVNLLASKLKSRLKCTCVYTADLNSRRYFQNKIMAGYGNGVARTLKKLRTPKGDY